MRGVSVSSMMLMLPALAFGASAKDNPNVLIIYVDDMGIGDIGCYGGKYVPTPNIDRLAHNGLLFNQYYSAAPVSSASRCGVTTGQFPIRHGITTFLATKAHNERCEQSDYLDASAPSMGRAFQSAGYATAHIGKWHMGGGRDVYDAPSITEYGFDEYLSTYESPDADPAITATEWIWAPQDSVKRWRRTEYFVDKSIDFMARHKDTPFFLNFWPDDMHTPWVSESYADAKRATWATQIPFELVLEEFDKQLGRLFEAMDEMGLTENTIIIFTSDNGPDPSFESGRAAYMRGTKNSLYEGGIRMPFIIQYPNKIAAGEVNNSTVLSAMDLYPSLCSIAGISTEKGWQGDGENLSKSLLGRNEQTRKGDLMWDFGRNKSFNTPKNPYDKSPHLAIRRDKWKLLVNGDGSDAQLYNLDVDKFEMYDVADQNRALVEELKTKVCNWYATYKDSGK